MQTGKESKADLRQRRIEEFNALVSEYESGLLHYAERLLCNAASAEDVVQEAFIKLYRGWQGPLQPSPQVSAWLYRVVHNQAVDAIRRESRRSEAHQRHSENHQVMTSPGRPGAQGSAEDSCRKIKEALDRLPLRERELVILKVYEGKTYKEISAITGMKTGLVGNLLHHAMKKLTVELKKTGAL